MYGIKTVVETSDPGLGPSGGLKCFLFMTDVANLVIFVTISNRWHSSDFVLVLECVQARAGCGAGAVPGR